MATSLLSEGLKRKPFETSTSSLELQTLVSEENNNKRKDTNNNEKGKGKSKLKGDIKCYYWNNVGYIIKHYMKLTEDK